LRNKTTADFELKTTHTIIVIDDCSVNNLHQTYDSKHNSQLPTSTKRNTTRWSRTRSQLKTIGDMILLFQQTNRVTRLTKSLLVEIHIIVYARGPAFQSIRMWFTPVVASILGFLYGPFAAVLLHSDREISLAAGDGAEEGFAVVGEACDP
jgi:hypothetical protein